MEGGRSHQRGTGGYDKVYDKAWNVMQVQEMEKNEAQKKMEAKMRLKDKISDKAAECCCSELVQSLQGQGIHEEVRVQAQANGCESLACLRHIPFRTFTEWASVPGARLRQNASSDHQRTK